MSDEKPAPNVNFEIQVPDEFEVGAYANFMSVWHTPHDFTLDFAVTSPGHENDEGGVTVPCRVVARVRIPLTAAEDILQALARHVSKFEELAGGRIHKPGEGDGAPRAEGGGR